MHGLLSGARRPGGTDTVRAAGKHRGGDVGAQAPVNAARLPDPDVVAPPPKGRWEGSVQGPAGTPGASAHHLSKAQGCLGGWGPR